MLMWSVVHLPAALMSKRASRMFSPFHGAKASGAAALRPFVHYDLYAASVLRWSEVTRILYGETRSWQFVTGRVLEHDFRAVRQLQGCPSWG